MRYVNRFAVRVCRRWLLGVAIVVLVSGMPVPASAQGPPPVQGTIALEGAIKTFYRTANTIIVTTIDGVEHVYHFMKGLVVHGEKAHGVDALEGLREGTTLVVHYTVQGGEESAREIGRIRGDEGLKVTEGGVTRIDHARKRITIRFDHGKTETLRLTDRAAAESAKEVGATKVVVYYSDENGQKVAHYFKKRS